MPVIDTHSHNYLSQFDKDSLEALERAKAVGISKILLPNIDSTTIDAMNSLCSKSEICLPMMGLHPCSVNENFKKELEIVADELEKGGYIAVGEMGTDLYWDDTFWKEQQEAFNIQCELALKHDLPIVIHCRETIDETIGLVRPWAKKGLRGVFHCFSGNLDQANEMIGMGFYLGIGGVSTFKNGGLDKVLPFVDKTRVVLETDSPYLAPVPHRGKRNEPAYTAIVAQRIAEFWQMNIKEVDSITTNNATQLFRLDEV